MGYGEYSYKAHESITVARSSVPIQEVFKQKECHPLMNPKGVRVRECRDSDDHPLSMGIVFALDVTGSMGAIPRLLATEQLPSFMKILTDCRVPDPQLLFMGVGDATSDRAPLQVGQFESTGELMDKWLTWSFLEGGGGGSFEESYELALYFLAVHTDMDCVVKRKKKGYLFLTGDEHPYPILSKHTVESVIGDRLDDDLKAEEIVAELQNTFVPFFLIPDQQRRAGCERRWRDLLGDHVLCMDDPRDTCYVAAGAILLHEGIATDVDQVVSILKGAGIPADRLAPTIRALGSLADPDSGLPDVREAGSPGLLNRFFKNIGL